MARGVYSRLNTDGERRWYVRIMVNGAYRRFGPRGGWDKRKDAATFATRAKADISRGIFFPDQFDREPIALQTLLKEQTARLPVTANTKNDRHYEAWWIRHYGTADARAITPATIEQATERLKKEKKSEQTIYHYLKFLRHRFTLALRDELLDRSPFHKIRLKHPRILRVRFYSPEERQRLYDALGPIWCEAAELAGLTGLRWSEQFQLTREHIFLEKGFVWLPTTKADQPQPRFLNQRAQELIAKQLARHRHPWLYPSASETGPMVYSYFRRRIWAPACKAAGLTNARWNDWRHTFATDLTQAGHSDRTVADLMGHTTTQMVKRYAHLTSAHLRQAVESLSKLRPTSEAPHEPTVRK